MLLQLENTDPENINKLLSFARENHLELSVIDDDKDNYFLPGKALTHDQLTQLIESARKSGVISLEKAHRAITDSLNAG
jgi:hypothetical protein